MYKARDGSSPAEPAQDEVERDEHEGGAQREHDLIAFGSSLDEAVRSACDQRLYTDLIVSRDRPSVTAAERSRRCVPLSVSRWFLLVSADTAPSDTPEVHQHGLTLRDVLIEHASG